MCVYACVCACAPQPPSPTSPTSPSKSLMGSSDSSFFSSTMESVARDLVKARWLELVTSRTNHSLQFGGEQLEVSLGWTRHLQKQLEIRVGIFYVLMIGLDWIKGKSEQETCFLW